MGSATSVNLSRILTLFTLFLYVIYQANCLGITEPKTARLTTFGNQAAPPQKTPTTTQAPVGKECRSDQECTFVQNATCKKAPNDQKMRCLCPDKTAPRSASCKHSKVPLHGRCTKNEECMAYAECRIPANSTNSNNPNFKSCMCAEGYTEEDHECNGGIMTAVPSLHSSFLLILLCPVLQLLQF